RGDVFANERARIRAVIDEQRKGRSARQRLDAERSRSGKQVEHTSSGNRVVMSMYENVEERLSLAIGGRTNCRGFPTAERALPPTGRRHVRSSPCPAAAVLGGADDEGF